MNPVTGSIVFIVIWWLVFFMALPFGVRSQYEDNHIEEGTEPGAPTKPLLLKKMAITTGVSILVWLLVYFALSLQLIPLDIE